MSTQDDRGAKPYKTYKASSRPRRSQLDDELAGARPPRQRPSDGNGSAGPAYPPRTDKAYRTYGPDPNSKKAKKQAKKAAAAAGKRKRRFRWWHVPIILLALIVIAGVVATVIAWPGYQKFDRAVDKANKRVDKKTKVQLAADSGWIWRNGTTVLLLGLDSGSLTQAHSDTIMLMHFDAKSHKINQLSIPRDTLVDIPGYGQGKLTEAMWYGGMEGSGSSLALKTVKQYTGIPINHIVLVSFQGFPRLVNSVGGVDFYVPQTVSTGAGPGVAGSTQRVVTFKKGMHHFDGKNAMLYVRIRKAYLAGGDFTRAARQQAFLQALQKKLMRPSNITKLPEIGRHFMSGVATDLTTNQILELAYLKWRANGGTKQVMKGQPGWYNQQSVVLPPSQGAREYMIKKFLGE
jgi:polyisoprenyl-teichoic acid--peptidoglycan teichoic acid transferase